VTAKNRFEIEERTQPVSWSGVNQAKKTVGLDVRT